MARDEALTAIAESVSATLSEFRSSEVCNTNAAPNMDIPTMSAATIVAGPVELFANAISFFETRRAGLLCPAQNQGQ